MLEARELTKKYGSRTVVDHLSFTIRERQICGFLGVNGAGKSTTMNMLTGCLAPTSGDVLLDGVSILDGGSAVRQKIGYLPEIPPVYPEMTPPGIPLVCCRAEGCAQKSRSRRRSTARWRRRRSLRYATV